MREKMITYHHDVQRRVYALDTDCRHVRLTQVGGPELWQLEITLGTGVIVLGIYQELEHKPIHVHEVDQARSQETPRQEG